MEEKSPRKRPRPVVSCLRCRDKKLKCDRTAPCQNCVKASRANTCVYNRSGKMPANPGPEPSQSASSVESVQSNPIEDLQQRLARVEELLGVSQRQRSSETAHVERQCTSPPSVLGTETVRGDQSHHYREDSRVTLLNQVRHSAIAAEYPANSI